MKRNSPETLTVYRSVFSFVCCGLLAGSLVGCSGQQTAAVNESNQDDQVDSSEVVAAESKQPQHNSVASSVAPSKADSPESSRDEVIKPDLKGVWYGESVYDVDAYQAKLDQLNPEQANRLQQMMSTFASIIMAAEFRPDEVMELDMMITTQEGQQMRDRSVGTWKILSLEQSELKIETSEYKNQDQQPTQKTYVYQFIDSDRFQFIPDSISPDLKEFEPRIIFQRVDQPLSEAAVAEGESNEVVR